MLRKTISVVVLAFNEENNITECLESLMNQTVTPDEIIIVDNNSTDKTVQIAKKYPIKILHETRQGIAHARNAGFSAAQGVIIARIDADCVAHKNWVENILLSMEDDSVAGVTGLIASKEFSAKNKFWFGWLHILYRYIHRKQLKLVQHIMYGNNMAVRKFVWSNIRAKLSTDESLVTEDLDLSLYANKFGKIIFNNKVKSKTKYLRSISKTKKLQKTDRSTIAKFVKANEADLRS